MKFIQVHTVQEVHTVDAVDAMSAAIFCSNPWWKNSSFI